MGRASILTTIAVLLAACGPAAAPRPPQTPIGAISPSSGPASASELPAFASPRRLTLRVDPRPGRCPSATVSARTGRPVVSLEWRSGAGDWRPWPVGPSETIRRGSASLEVCPGWIGGRLQIRAVSDDRPPSLPARIHNRAERWMRGLERLIGARPLSASVMVDGAFVYGHLAGVRRAPASNEKLLLSMAVLDRFGPGARIITEAATRGQVRDGVVRGDLYLVGHGDPELDAEDVHRLAVRLRAAGVTRITGGVVGDTSAFVRDRRARGWHPIALRHIGLPTALSYGLNVDADGFVFDPESRAAEALDADLRALGVGVGSAPARGRAPKDPRTIAVVRSAPIADILRRQNVSSINLAAETLGKALATETLGRPGSIAAGADVVEDWANDLDAHVRLHDSSGLSYRNRVSTVSMAALLDDALGRSWGDALRGSLPAPGEGTLGGRLGEIRVRAKTGTLLRNVSALSGYIRLRDGGLASFSIISELPKDEAVALEDAIVRIIAAHVETDERKNETFGGSSIARTDASLRKRSDQRWRCCSARFIEGRSSRCHRRPAPDLLPRHARDAPIPDRRPMCARVRTAACIRPSEWSRPARRGRSAPPAAASPSVRVSVVKPDVRRYSAASRGWSRPNRYASVSASHDAWMMFSLTPTVVHSRSPLEVSISTRTVAPVPTSSPRTRTR